MQLSQDDAKIIIDLLNQLTYKLKDASVVLPIIDRLQSCIDQPDLKIEKPMAEKQAEVAVSPVA